MKSLTISPVRGAAWAVAAVFFFSAVGWAQQSPAPSASPAAGEAVSAVHDLQDQVRELRSLVEEMRAENAESRAEMHQLRHDLEATRALLERPAPPANGAAMAASASSENGSGVAAVSAASGTTGAATPPLEERVQKLEESAALIGSKIDEQYQTKVESASRYRARIHGIVLMNAFRNVGGSDNLDFPSYSQPVATGSPRPVSVRHCASLKSDWKSSARTSPEPELRPTCNSISREDSPPPATA